jgi:meiotic recombination protein SPO11
MSFVSARVPVVALVDGDAYGLDIVSVYKFGSVALRHEADKLAAPRVECIGIWASELASQVPRLCLFSDMRSLEQGSGSTKTH